MSFHDGVATEVLNFWEEEKIKLKEEIIDIVQNQRIQLSVQILPKLIVLHHKQRELWINKYLENKEQISPFLSKDYEKYRLEELTNEMVSIYFEVVDKMNQIHNLSIENFDELTVPPKSKIYETFYEMKKSQPKELKNLRMKIYQIKDEIKTKKMISNIDEWIKEVSQKINHKTIPQKECKKEMKIIRKIEREKSTFYDLISQNLNVISSKYYDYQNFVEEEIDSDQLEEEVLEEKKDENYEFIELIKKDIFIDDCLLKIHEMSNEEFKEDEEFFEKTKKFLLKNTTINEEETVKFQNFLLLLLNSNSREKNLILQILQTKNSNFWVEIIQFLSPELKLYSKYKQFYFPILEDLKIKRAKYKTLLMKIVHPNIDSSVFQCYESLLMKNKNKKINKRINQIENLLFKNRSQQQKDFDYLFKLYEVFEFNLLDLLEYRNIDIPSDLQILVLQKNLKEISTSKMEDKIDFLNYDFLVILNWFQIRLKSNAVKNQWKMIIIEILFNFMKRVNYHFNNLFEIFLQFFEDLMFK
eukprot:gene8241-66_t